MSFLNLDRLRAAALKREPYEYLTVSGFVKSEALADVNGDFPEVEGTGSYPVDVLHYGKAFGGLLDELKGAAFRQAIADKFDVDLDGKAMTCTIRGRCQLRDGRIHTDSETKIITGLIYLNKEWTSPGGRLRILRHGDRLDDYAEEVEPAGGNLLVFRRSERSWHGHEPYEGERRSIQINWVTSQKVAASELARHRLSARLKKLNPFQRGKRHGS